MAPDKGEGHESEPKKKAAMTGGVEDHAKKAAMTDDKKEHDEVPPLKAARVTIATVCRICRKRETVAATATVTAKGTATRAGRNPKKKALLIALGNFN